MWISSFIAGFVSSNVISLLLSKKLQSNKNKKAKRLKKNELELITAEIGRLSNHVDNRQQYDILINFCKNITVDYTKKDLSVVLSELNSVALFDLKISLREGIYYLKHMMRQLLEYTHTVPKQIQKIEADEICNYLDYTVQREAGTLAQVYEAVSLALDKKGNTK